MDFEAFFNCIFDILGGTKDMDVFMRELFDQILDPKDDGEIYNPLYDKSGPTLRKYVNPNDTRHYLPARFVKEIHGYLDPAKFSTYLLTFPDQTREDLSKALESLIDGVTPYNVHDKCADYFKQILDNIIGLNQEPVQMTLATIMATSLPHAIADKYGPRLLLETQGFCPSKGSTNELKVITENGEAVPTYIPTVIDGIQPPTYENLIALCPACHARYLAEQQSSSNSRGLNFLRQKKRELMVEDAANIVLSQHEIEQGVDRLLRKIQDELLDLSEEDLSALHLNYDPVKVRQKIPGDTWEQRSLLKKVLRNVRENFNVVDQTLKNLNKEQVIRQRKFSAQIKNLFIDLDETTINGYSLSQTVIFNKLVDWLHRKTGEDIDICAIVISYFVQSCEVYDAIS